MRISKKLVLMLMAVALVTLSLPVPTARAVATTVEVNNGNTIALNVGENITGSATAGIPISVKNIATNATGLAAFDFTFTWNPAVIRVDRIRGATNATDDFGWGFTPGTPNNTTGTVTIVGTTTQTPYSKADLTMAYLGIGAVGNPGDSTSINITITNLTDNLLQEITPRTAVNAPVQISLGTLLSIAVTPSNPSIAAGLTQQFTANGTYTAGTVNITGTANWTSSNTAVATIGLNTGLATALAQGTTVITATSGNVSGSTTLTVTAAQLVSIAVTPVNPSIALGLTKQFNATGNFTLGTSNITTTANWTSSNTGVATIGLNTGLATSLTMGTTVITATSGAISANTTLTVTAVELVSIAVTPAAPTIVHGQTPATQQFNATGTYSNATTANLTANATWTSANTSVATVNATSGLATSKWAGTTVIRATSGAISGNTTLTVTIATTVQVNNGNTIVLDVGANITGSATGGIPIDVKGIATNAQGLAAFDFTFTWNPAVIRVDRIRGATNATDDFGWGFTPGTPNNTTGTVTIVGTTTQTPYSKADLTMAYLGIGAVGNMGDNTTITITITNLTDNALQEIPALPVNAPVQISLGALNSITVTPANPSIVAGLTQQFNATGNFTLGTSNITTTANWTSSNTGVATIGLNTGMATSIAAGTTVITATSGNVSGSTTLTVTAPVVVSIVVTPANPSIALGLTKQFSATGTYNNNATANITTTANWTSSNASVATIGLNTGLASSKAVGTTTITATWGSASNNTMLTVTAAELLSIAVTPAFTSIPLGLTQQYSAIGTYTDATTANITGSANWTSSTTTVATIGATGLASSVAQGTTTITASLSGKTSPGVTLVVTAPILLSVRDVFPVTANITAGSTQQFLATGTFTNGEASITNTATWTSSDPSIASINTAGQTNPGRAIGYKPGTVTITATQSGKSATATLTVLAATIQSIAVSPVNPTTTISATQKFRAIASYPDGSKVEVTLTANWTSSNTTVATIGLNTGVATTLAAGTTVIKATSGTVSGNTTLTVLDVPLVSIAVTPANPSIAAGKTQPFIATGNYSGILVDLTGSANWTSSNTTVARIVAGGLASSYAAGTTTITAKDVASGITGNTVLTVTAAELDAVVVTPVNPTIAFVSGAPPTLEFKATAVYTDGSTTDNTTTANWASSAPGVATIGANTGLATTVAAGTTTISANLGGKTGNSLLTVLADKVAPVVKLDSPSEGLIISSTNLTVTGSVDDVNATTTVIVNDGAPIALPLVGGNFSQVVTLTAGGNTVLVKAVDGAGNAGTPGTRTVLVDPRKPVITITSPLEGLVTTNSARTVTGNVVGATSATMRVNGIAVATVSGDFSQGVTLVEGQNTIVVSGYKTGESTEAFLGTSGVRTVTLDTTAPLLTITSPTDGSWVAHRGIQVTGTVDDPALTSVTLTVSAPNETPKSYSVPVTKGSFTHGLALLGASGTTNTITVVAIDALNNTSSTVSVTVTYDITKPVVTIITPVNKLLTNVGGQLVTGNVSDISIATATLYVNAVPQTIPVAPDGSFSQLVALKAGPNLISVWATDAAGNTGKSGEVNVKLDSTPPVVTIGLSDPTDSTTITVASDKALTAAGPTVNVNVTAITMTQIASNKWTGVFGPPIPAGTYTVTATGTDLAGNPTTTTAVFLKQALNVVAGNATSVQAGATGLQITTNTTLANQSISVTQHTENPAKNAASGKAAGIFVEIVASANLTNSIESVTIRVNYDEADIIARGIEESTLKLYLWSVTTGQWELVPGSGVNTEQNYIFGTVTHLSKYGGFGTALVTPPPDTGGGIVTPPPTITTVTTPGLSSEPALRVDKDGIVVSDAQLTTTDKKAYLNIAKNTKMLDAQGKALGSLSAQAVTTPAATPAGKAIISAYDFGPTGATFNPTIALTMTYTEPLSGGVLETGLYLAYWDGTKWVALDSKVDAAANKVTAATSHFTQFALIGTVPAVAVIEAPAAFTTSTLSISPTKVNIGESVTISVLVTNTGGLSGSYKVTLKIDNAVVETKDVTLAGGARQTVTFTTSKNVAGSYAVTIDALSGTFTVKPAAIGWWVWLIVVLVVAAIIAGVVWQVRRRRTA